LRDRSIDRSRKRGTRDDRRQTTDARRQSGGRDGDDVAFDDDDDDDDDDDECGDANAPRWMHDADDAGTRTGADAGGERELVGRWV
jgi:hypothetical protein